jgi:hypothetical protein
VGFRAPDQPRGIYSLSADGEIKVLAKDIGRLDGVYRLRHGSLLVTEWNSGSLSQWNPKAGMRSLAKGFKGPADFCVVHDEKGFHSDRPRPGEERAAVRAACQIAQSTACLTVMGQV